MNTIMAFISILSVSLSIACIVTVTLALRSSEHLTYRKKLMEFELKKRRIEEDLENERRDFEQNS